MLMHLKINGPIKFLQGGKGHESGFRLLGCGIIIPCSIADGDVETGLITIHTVHSFNFTAESIAIKYDEGTRKVIIPCSRIHSEFQTIHETAEDVIRWRNKRDEGRVLRRKKIREQIRVLHCGK